MQQSLLSGYVSDFVLDITRDACPMTFVRTRLALDRMRAGQTLLVRISGEEPRRSVQANAEAQGHAVLAIEDDRDGVTLLLLQKA